MRDGPVGLAPGGEQLVAGGEFGIDDVIAARGLSGARHLGPVIRLEQHGPS